MNHLAGGEMFGKRLGIAILSVVTLLGATAVAQDEKNEVGGMIGRIFISDQPITGATYTSPTIAYGKGLTFEGFYGRRLLVTPLYAISGEAVLAYDGKELPNAGDYQNSVVPQSLKELFVTPAVRANLFPTTAVSPWASLGAGFGHISEYPTLLYSGANPGKSTTSFAFQWGIGLDVKVWKQLFIRGEMRDFWSGSPDYPLAPTGKSRQQNYFVGGGGFWRF